MDVGGRDRGNALVPLEKEKGRPGMKLSNQQFLVIGLVILAILWYLKKQAGDAVAAAGEAVNPTSDQNLAYRGVNAVGEAISGDDGWSLGSWMYDVMHPEEGEDLD